MALCRTLDDIYAAVAQEPPDEIRSQEWADRMAAIFASHLPVVSETQAA